MKILVPIKLVVDSDRNPSPADAGNNGLQQDLVFDPLSAIALEQAVRIKNDGDPATKVVTVTIAGPDTALLLTRALAMGADRAILLEQDTQDILNSLDKAKLLLKMLHRESPDLVLMGTESMDLGNQQTASMLARLSGWPQALSTTDIELSDSKCRVLSEQDGANITLELELPTIIGVDLNLNQPHVPGLIKIMQAKSKPVQRIAMSSLYHPQKRYFEVLETKPTQRQIATTQIHNLDELFEVLHGNTIN